MNLDVYAQHLAGAARLKMRALRLLAEGSADARFEAAVLFHEAARGQRRAIETLPEPPAIVRLRAAVEECALLLDGLDPRSAANAWGTIVTDSAELRAAEVRPLLTRITDRYEHEQRSYARALAGAPTLRSLEPERGLVPMTAAARSSLLKEAQALADKYPGVSSFWWMMHRLKEASAAHGEAWKFLDRAHQLEPDNARFEAMRLLTSARARPPAATDALLAATYARRGRLAADVCLLFAFTELTQFHADEAPIRLRRAVEVLQIGLTRAHRASLSQNLRAALMLIEEVQKGREPKQDLAYRAGLGSIAAQTLETGAGKVIALFEREAVREILNAAA